MLILPSYTLLSETWSKHSDILTINIHAASFTVALFNIKLNIHAAEHNILCFVYTHQC